MADYSFCKKQENGWAITNLGAALFARDLRKFPSLEFRYVVVRQYKGANNLDISAETFFYEGYAISLDKIVKYVMSLLEKTEDILHPRRQRRRKIYRGQCRGRACETLFGTDKGLRKEA